MSLINLGQLKKQVPVQAKYFIAYDVTFFFF